MSMDSPPQNQEMNIEILEEGASCLQLSLKQFGENNYMERLIENNKANLTFEESGWKIYENSLYYSCTSSVSLKLFHNRTLFKSEGKYRYSR